MDWSGDTILWALLGGIIPALVWLWFWLKEDSRHPEPARIIFYAFVGGMLIVPIALVLEKVTEAFLSGVLLRFGVWAAIEELLKFWAAYLIAFRKKCIDRSRCFNDTLDPIIYLITVALGFSALENALFLWGPIAGGNLGDILALGNLRFIGSTVLHVLASASIGVALGFSFYKTRHAKKIYAVFGIFTAVILHTLFNISIINSSGEEDLFLIFGTLWIGIFVLLALFEKLKKIQDK